MAVSSLSSTICPLTVSKFPSISPKPKFSVLSLSSSASTTLIAPRPSRPPIVKVFAAPEVLDVEETSAESESVTLEVEGSEAPGSSSPLCLTANVDKSAVKQKIRIKLRSYYVPLIEDSCKQILDAAMRTNAKIVGPVPLPTKRRVYCILKSPHVHKDARFHFEIRTHQRLIDILYPTAQTIDSLMLLDIPAGVDVEVKL